MTGKPASGRRRLVRTSGLAEFRRALAVLALEGGALSAVRRGLILPTQAAAAIFRQSLERTLRPGQGFVLPALMTREAWLVRLHQALPGAPPLLTRFDREVLMGRAASAAARRTRVGGAPFDLRPGLIAEMLGFYDELRRRQRTVRRFAGVLFDELGGERGMDRGSDSLIQQTCFLAFAFLAYERGVAASGSIDEHALRRLVLARADACPFDHLVIGVGDHPADPRGLWAADFDLLGRLGGRLDVDIVVTDETHDAGFRHRIEQELPGLEEVRAAAVGVSPSEQTAPVLVRPPLDRDDSICHVHRDREEELRAVARDIRRNASMTDGELRQATAVVFQRPLPYLYLADQVLGDAGIPYEVFDARPLAGEPSAAALDLVLDVACTGGTRETIDALLRSPLLSFEGNGGLVEAADAAALAGVLAARRADGEADSYPDEVERHFAGRGFRHALEGDRARRAAVAAADIGRALRPFRDAPAASDQIRTLIDFLDRHQRPFEATEPIGGRHRRGQAAIRAVLEGLAEACRRYDDEARPAGRLAAEIRHRVERHTFAPTLRGPGVTLADAVAARFGEFECVHLVGLVDSEWPERSKRNIFYTTGLLKSLGWPQEPDEARAQQAAFRDLVRLPTRTLHLHGFELEGDALVGLSPAVELARDLPGEPSAPPLPTAVFPDERLTHDPPFDAGLPEDQVRWLQLRRSRASLDDPRYSGFAGSRPPRAYRVSRVDRYVDCPFKFFAEDVLGLPEEREEWSGLSPLERGTLVHSLFERFYAEWHRQGRGTISAESMPDALALFARLTQEALARLPEADRALEETRLLGSIVGRGLAERVFELEADAGGEVVDRLLEYPLEGPFAFPRMQDPDRRVIDIRGKADRVDVFANGELRVIDYKLTRVPDRDVSIQLAVYAWAVQQALEARDGRAHPVTQAMYVAFGDERRSEGGLDLPGARTAATVAARASDFTAAVDRIEAGEFPPDPRRPAGCHTCGYAGVCRKEYAAKPV